MKMCIAKTKHGRDCRFTAVLDDLCIQHREMMLRRQKKKLSHKEGSV